jgi:hypothetical protein
MGGWGWIGGSGWTGRRNSKAGRTRTVWRGAFTSVSILPYPPFLPVPPSQALPCLFLRQFPFLVGHPGVERRLGLDRDKSAHPVVPEAAQL